MKFIDVLFCDDIRVEINNKVSLMGLYNDRIVFRTHDQTKIEWPAKMDLAILVRLSISEKDMHPISFTFECFSNEKSVVKIEGDADLASSNGSIFALILNTKNISLNSGNLGYSIKIFDKDKNTEYLSKIDKNALTVLGRVVN
ncbi:MAG TPA: hypothetical protein VLI69_07895 [Gammaproteobacteria bacterium]|nr:hypothetical protein [Gammaproteobacteria bacterium]